MTISDQHQRNKMPSTALKQAQIQRLNASAAKDRQSVRESMNRQLTPNKTP